MKKKEKKLLNGAITGNIPAYRKRIIRIMYIDTESILNSWTKNCITWKSGHILFPYCTQLYENSQMLTENFPCLVFQTCF